MKNLIIFSIVVIVLASFISMQAVNSISQPETCIGCHGSKHQENPLFFIHSNKSINCVECHSGYGVQGYVEARKELSNAVLSKKSMRILSYIFNNVSLKSNYVHLQANCIKCHEKIKSTIFNHSS